MDWHGTMGVPSSYVSWDYVSNISSICWVNPKLLICQYRVLKWGINGGEGKWALMFPKDIEPFIWWLLSYPSPPLLYNPSFLTKWASFAHFSFEEKEESPRVRVYLWFLREERILSRFSIFCIPSKFMKWGKLFEVWKLKLLTHFSNTRHSFIKLQTFSFIEPHEINFFIMDCKNLFSPESHEIHLGIEWDMVLHDPKWKSYHMKSSSIFQFWVKFSLPVHDFDCWSILSSLRV